MISLLAGLIKPAHAYLYNEGQSTRQLVVDKQIKAVTDSSWHDNLPGTTFTRGNLIDFRIIVRNSGDQDLDNIKVNDALPNYVKPIFHPGTYNEQQKIISWEIAHLKAGAESTEKIRVQVIKTAQLSSQPLAIVNRVEAKSNGLSDADQAQFLVAAGKLPQAGANLAASGIIIAALFSLGYVGRKIGRGELF